MEEGEIHVFEANPSETIIVFTAKKAAKLEDIVHELTESFKIPSILSVMIWTNGKDFPEVPT